MSSYSTELLVRAQTVIPGGVNSPVRSFKGVGGAPLFFKGGMGPYLIDVEDKKYIDYVGSFGPLILGHAHEKVLMAIQEAAKRGLSFGANTPIEIEMAEFLTKTVPYLDQVRLVCSGTEATQSAIRLARGFTQRPKIIKFEGCYHGHVDSLLVKAGSGLMTLGISDSAGIPDSFVEHTVNIPFNDIATLEKTFKTFGSDIAAVIIEPVAGNMNCILPLPEFLATLRKLCSHYDSLLIFDEIITGFRVALPNAATVYNIKPDLICLGKIIGGGLPVGAFGGRREIMEYLAPNGPVYQAGTLSGNPLALSAGLATLKALYQPQIFATIEKNTHDLINGLKKCADKHSIPFKTQAIGGLFGFYFTEEDVILNQQDVMKSNLAHFKHFFHAMLKEGIYFAPSAFEAGFMSAAHTKEDIEQSLHAAEKVFKTWPKIC